MAAAAAPQEGQSFKNVDVRKATNADTADIIAAVAEGYKASIRPIFLAALKGEGFDQILHVICLSYGIALAPPLCVYMQA
jgi:hypothetical protein